MGKLTKDEFDEFLAEYRIVHIATVKEDGSPYVVPATFLSTGTEIIVAARGRSAWWANLVRDQRVSLCIDETAAPARRVIITDVQAKILYEPGREKEWIDIKRSIELKGMTQEGTEHYLTAVSRIPYALVSFPFDYESKSVTSWRADLEGSDFSGLMPKKYGEIINPEGNAGGDEIFKEKK